MMNRTLIMNVVRLLSGVVLTLAMGCGSGTDGDADADVDADSDSDTDVDSDADTDVDVDVDVDGDADEDGDGDGDGDGDADEDGDGDADIDGDADADEDAGGWCPGYVEPEGAALCRSSDDCTEPSETCWEPGAVMCGACMPTERECERDTCPEDTVCEEYEPRCSCGDGPSSRCVPDCRFDRTYCGDEQPCGDDGLCVPIDCTMFGVSCPASAECSPGAPNADDRGCVRRACTEDGACDCGACVFGRCHDGPGTCSPPVP
jgi:hypothetical protein